MSYVTTSPAIGLTNVAGAAAKQAAKPAAQSSTGALIFVVVGVIVFLLVVIVSLKLASVGGGLRGGSLRTIGRLLMGRK